MFYCIINDKKYTLRLTSTSIKTIHPVFIIPVPAFLKAGAVWRVLKLCTIFWESAQNNETLKIEYLLAFQTYSDQASKIWARECLIENKYNLHEAYFELNVYDPNFVVEIENAFKKYGIKCIHGDDNVITVV
jgi:hypothetical protein